mgnify:FL=1
MPTIHRPRLVVEITPEQRELLNKYLAYGEQRRVFQAILTDMAAMLEEFGYNFVTFMLQREFSYRTLMEAHIADRGFADTNVECTVTEGPTTVNP